MSYQDFPPALLILSPRLTIAGNPNASVVGINTTELADGSFVYCLENRGEYQLDRRDNATPANGVTVLAPLTGPGRWKRLAVGGTGSIVQMGWDQVAKEHTLALSAFTRTITRDAADSIPLQVQLPNVTPGNILRMALSGVAINTDEGPHTLTTLFVVSFDGTTAFGTGFFAVNNSNYKTTAPAGEGAVLGGTNFVEIPAGATIATVQVVYDDGGAVAPVFDVSGLDNGFAPGVNLDVTELARGNCSQFGPTSLIPL